MNLRRIIVLLLLAASGCASDRPLTYPRRPKVAVRNPAEPALTVGDPADNSADRPDGREPF